MSLQGRYTVVRKIADGGMAEVFLARQHGAEGFEKLVVLKRVRPAYWADPHFRDMLIAEAHVAMGMAHGNIVQVLDLGEAGGRYFLALELVDGWTVEELLTRAQAVGMRFPIEIALYLTGEICRALAYAHAHTTPDGKSMAVVHRDVSTHNVLVAPEGEVKLTDFGIAKAENIRREDTGSQVVKGKVAFMSPEQANGEPLDARSDLFSAGVMLYMMAVGRRPFEGKTDLETLLKVRACQFAPPMRPGMNPQVGRIILRAMRKAPGERYQKADEMLADVERVLRLGFRPVGKTELAQWLGDLARKDGAIQLSKQTVGDTEDGELVGGTAPPPQTGSPTVSERAADGGARPPPPPPAQGNVPPPATDARPAGARGLPTWFVGRLRHDRKIQIATAVVTLGLVLGLAAILGGGGPSPSGPDPDARATSAATAPVPADETIGAEDTTAAVEAMPTTDPASGHDDNADDADDRDDVAELPAAAATDRAAGMADVHADAGAATDPTVDRAAAAAPAPDSDEAAPARTGAPRTSRVRVQLTSKPAGATVKKGAHRYGKTPTEGWLRPGQEYHLVFTKPGYAPARVRFTPRDEAGQRVLATLERAAGVKPKQDRDASAGPARRGNKDKPAKKKWYWPF